MKTVKEAIQELMQEFPLYRNQLQEALNAYEFPLKTFQEREAEFRLQNLGIESDLDNFDIIKDKIVHDFDKSEYFLDYDVINMIVDDVVSSYTLNVLKEEDLENVRNPNIKISRSNKDVLVSFVMKANYCDSEKIQKQMKELLSFYDYISLKKLKKMYQKVSSEFTIDEIVNIARSNNMTANELIEEAECVSEYHEWMHMKLLGYTSEQLLEAAKKL